MSKKTSKENEFIEIPVPDHLSGLLPRYHDRTLADNSLSDIEVILLSIYLLELRAGKTGIEYSQCKKAFVTLGRSEEAFRKRAYECKTKGLIEDKSKDLFLKIKGIKHLRNLFGQLEKSPVHIIKSGENFSAIKLFEEFLHQEMKGDEILLCDSHISHNTLFPFSILKGIKSLKILTANVYDSDKFKEYKKKLQKEMGLSIEVKINQKIHDRFVICGKKCWTIGSSIKDLGNKDAILREITEVFTSMKELFSERWDEAESP
jgi:hypothetical protein